METTNYAYLMHEWLSSPMAIMESHWNFLRAASPEAFDAGDKKALGVVPKPYRQSRTDPSTAIIDIHGPIAKGVNPFLAAMFGLCDLDSVDAALEEAGNDPSILRVTLDVDSPGGSVVGVEDTMNRVRKLDQQKPVSTRCKKTMASAAYFIGSQGRDVSCSRSAQIGSIGVIMGVYDESARAEKEGIKPVVVRSSQLKAPGYMPGEQITEEQAAHLQERVDKLYAIHDEYIAEKRPALASEHRQGQVYTGREAVDIGMVDAIY